LATLRLASRTSGMVVKNGPGTGARNEPHRLLPQRPDSRSVWSARPYSLAYLFTSSEVGAICLRLRYVESDNTVYPARLRANCVTFSATRGLIDEARAARQFRGKSQVLAGRQLQQTLLSAAGAAPENR